MTSDFQVQRLRSAERISQLEATIGSLGARLCTNQVPRNATAASGTAAMPGMSVEEIVLLKKVTNAMLYFRYALGRNLDGLREKYVSDANIIHVTSYQRNGPRVRRLQADAVRQLCPSDSYEWHSAFGGALWHFLVEEETDYVRDLYVAWKERLKATVGIDLDKLLRSSKSGKG